MFSRTLSASLLLLTLAGSGAIAQRPAYTISDLGDLGGGFSNAKAINSQGDIVGESNLADGSVRPFLYSNGVMHDLGTHLWPAGVYSARRVYALCAR